MTSQKGSELAVVTREDILKDPNWREIVESLVSQIGPEVPDKVVEATELLVNGWPTYKVARRLGTDAATVKRWLEKYPTMAAAVAEGRRLMSEWRMGEMEQQFFQAVRKSEEILELDIYDKEVNAKALGIVAMQTRFVIGLFLSQKTDVDVKINTGDPTLKAKADALDYLASRINAQRESGEPIEATYKVVDSTSAPILDEFGAPFFGQMGELDHDENGAVCHICGERLSAFTRHIQLVHKMSAHEYEMTFLLSDGSVRKVG